MPTFNLQSRFKTILFLLVQLEGEAWSFHPENSSMHGTQSSLWNGFRDEGDDGEILPWFHVSSHCWEVTYNVFPMLSSCRYVQKALKSSKAVVTFPWNDLPFLVFWYFLQVSWWRRFACMTLSVFPWDSELPNPRCYLSKLGEVFCSGARLLFLPIVTICWLSL